MSKDLHHFYHIYADGDWREPVVDHVKALRYDGLYDALATLNIGFVGSKDNILQVQDLLAELNVDYATVAESLTGWEQETLIPLHEHSKSHNGYVSYAHTKGAAHFAKVNNQWRRSMEFYNFCTWREVVKLLDAGKRIVGCHWVVGGEAHNPAWGTGGMFGGNYWWTNYKFLCQAPPIGTDDRYAAEHWLGQLSEVLDLSADEYIGDLNPNPIGPGYLKDDW